MQKNYFSVKKIWDGIEREYLVFLPSSYLKAENRKFPVLIGLHGYSGTASGFELETTKVDLNTWATVVGVAVGSLC